MEKQPLSPTPSKERTKDHSLTKSGFDEQAPGKSMPAPGTELAANEPVQMQRKDPTDFPWKGTVTGIEKAPLFSTAAEKAENKVGAFAKGTEVSVLASSGSFLKVKGTTIENGEKEGYAAAKYISGTISELNQTVAAMDGTMDKLWEDSFNEDKTKVQEHGTAFMEKDGKLSSNGVSKGGSGSVAIDRTAKEGETLVGDVHTHPYSKSEGEHEGVAFSAGDISNIRGDTCFQGYQKFVEAGTRRFALVVTDEVKAKKFFEDNSGADITAKWNKAFQAAKGSFQESVIEAVFAVIGKDGENGIQFYGTTDEEKLKFDAM